MVDDYDVGVGVVEVFFFDVFVYEGVYDVDIGELFVYDVVDVVEFVLVVVE